MQVISTRLNVCKVEVESVRKGRLMHRRGRNPPFYETSNFYFFPEGPSKGTFTDLELEEP